MRSLRFLGLALLTACAGSAAGSQEPVPGDAGGGNVSFGGAQDIGDFRSILDQGGVPGPDTLDPNGFFNEHFAPVPPGCTSTLCLTPGVAVGHDWITGAHQATLQLAVNTNVDPTTIQRKPLDVVAVIDRSGSMSEDGRLDKVKLGLHAMVDHLQDGDRLALVSFSSDVRIDADLTTLDRAALHAQIDALVPDGGTDIFDGLETGFQVAAQSDLTRERRVIFLSDGLANIGDSVPDDIIAMASSFVEDGIGVTTIGVGADFDVDLMRGLAERGAGNFYFLEDPAAAQEVFTEELDYFMEPLALDIQITASAGAGWRFGSVVGSTLWQSSDVSGSMQIPAVFVASRTSSNPGETGGRRGGGSMLFIQLTPIGGADADGDTIAHLSLTYTPPGGEPVTQDVTLAYPNDPNETPDVPYLSAPEMAPRFAMYNSFLGLRAATMTTDVNCASSFLIATKDGASAWLASHDDPDLADDITLIDQYLGNLRAVGATETTSSNATACADGTNPYGNPPSDDPGDYGYGPGYEGCASAGGPQGLLVGLGIAGMAVVRRRRRR
jgi:Ca-activated chloride channel family protein